jgi:molybdenum cofactor synthesis domain-containing protein
VVRFAVLTLSDRVAEGTRDDASGDRLVERITAAGHELVARAVLPDDRARIADQLRTWCDTGVADIVVTTGGTGLTERDVTPEATREIAERDVPGIVVALHLEGLKHTPLAVLSRGLAVTRGRTLVVNLPGSPSAMDDGMDVLLPLAGHIAQLLAGPVEHSG